METPEKVQFSFSNWVSSSVMLKLVIVGFLILVLLIPSSMLQSLITERQFTRDASIREITSKWGAEQLVGGPVISIPYKVVSKDEKGKIIANDIQYAHFLPENLKVNGKIMPEKRYRGIYVAMLYNSKLKIEGDFLYPKLELLNIPKENFMLDKAFISIGISDMKGINDALNLQLNDKNYAMNPGIETNDVFTSGLSTPIELTAKGMKFSFNLNLNGSGQLRFTPFGKETNVQVEANWDTPSFVGSFSPDDKKITNKNFTAHWKILHLNRNYPQQGLGNFLQIINNPESMELAKEFSPTFGKYETDSFASFGIKLLLPVDEYQKTMRSAKYNIMFIILTFVAFFFIEILNRKRLHPIQYLLVGFAICLFYVLLLSISEHLSFNWAYLIGCITILALVVFYTKAVFKNSKLTLIFNGVLALLYGFFYSLLQLESYALLIGSLGLLLILATVMYLTRHLDWYRPYQKE